MRSRNRGFTLLEMLLALAVFAMLGLATSNILSSTMSTHEIIKDQNDQLTELQRAFALIEADFLQLSQRKARVNGEAPSPQYFYAQESMLDSESIGFSFVRDGWVNPVMILPRSELQAVGYRVVEQTLERLYYNFVDPMMGEEPKVQPLLNGVEEINLEYWVGSEWVSDVPEQGLPSLIKVSLETKTFGEITRVFPLIRLTEKTTNKSGNDDDER